MSDRRKPPRDETPPAAEPTGKMSRRRFFGAGLTGATALLFTGFELVDHGVLPGQGRLELLEGKCSVPQPTPTFAAAGPARSGRFFSKARGREVGYTIAYPPGHRPGSELPLGIVLHAYGSNHTSSLGGPQPCACARGAGARAGAAGDRAGGGRWRRPVLEPAPGG
jgi:hypothetical protein